jgi:TonB family protein
MANDLLNPPKDEAAAEASRNSLNGSGPYSSASPVQETGHELDAFLGKAFEEKPFWKELYESVHDALFPPKLPPLELTSTPIPVADPMAVKRSPLSIGISALINLAILGALLYAFRDKIPVLKSMNLSHIDVDVSAWKPQTKKAGDMGGGGGGGAHEILQASKGHLPKIEKAPLTKPMIPILDKPKLSMEPAIDVQAKLPDNPNMPMIGVTNSPNVVFSNGTGGRGGIGSGSNGGVGSGNGNGFGPGFDGNAGGGVRKVGDGISAPSLIYKVEAEFSDEARRAKYEGAVIINLIVDANGNPQQVRVSRSLGMGLDEKALEAVKQYKFKPAKDKSGKPVPVYMSVEIDFHLY